MRKERWPEPPPPSFARQLRRLGATVTIGDGGDSSDVVASYRGVEVTARFARDANADAFDISRRTDIADIAAPGGRRRLSQLDPPARIRLHPLPDAAPRPAQQQRLEAIIASLRERITEAHERGWLGEVEGLQTSLAAAEQKFVHMRRSAVNHGLPVMPA